MKKATHATNRQEINHFQQIINVGPESEKDFAVLGIETPQQLMGRDPLELYHQLCNLTGQRHDRCVLDLFMSAIDYMDGNPPQKWWAFTELRKAKYGDALDAEQSQQGEV